MRRFEASQDAMNRDEYESSNEVRYAASDKLFDVCNYEYFRGQFGWRRPDYRNFSIVCAICMVMNFSFFLFLK